MLIQFSKLQEPVFQSNNARGEDIGGIVMAIKLGKGLQGTPGTLRLRPIRENDADDNFFSLSKIHPPNYNFDFIQYVCYY